MHFLIYRFNRFSGPAQLSTKPLVRIQFDCPPDFLRNSQLQPSTSLTGKPLTRISSKTLCYYRGGGGFGV
jgi:hypothetical protein